MKSLLVVMSLAALGGCAVAPPGGYYATAVPQNYDPHQWHVVSSQPVAGTVVQSDSSYAAAPVYADQSSGWVTQQVYVPAPVYIQQPYYNYYPPISIGLDFGWWGGRGWGGGGRGRGWGGGGGFHGGHR